MLYKMPGLYYMTVLLKQTCKANKFVLLKTQIEDDGV